MKLKTPYKFALLAAALGALAYVAILGARVITYTEGYFGRGSLDIAMTRAIEQGDRVLIWFLLAAGVPSDGAAGGSPLTAAALNGDLWTLEKLLKKGANPDNADVIVDNFSEPDAQMAYDPANPMPVYFMDRPIFWAAKRQERDAVALLREYGARYEFVDALFMADEPFVRDALTKDKALNETLARIRPRLLSLAVEYANLPAIELMLQLGFDPNETPEYGPSPLELARLSNQYSVLRVFDAHAMSAASQPN